ncbi:unnamed protein product [Penicillium olsonii]|nr:unnamed protein product [Penicillium olsonii]CAG8257448.1 unnamed protein product [Penicillium olsonii]
MTEASVNFIRNLVRCPVLSEADILVALTAAGADETLPDGNRKLAQLGSGVTGFLIDFSGATMALSRDFTSKLKFRVNSTTHRADIAKRTGVDQHLRTDPRPGGNSSGVLALAASATIGAIYLRTKSLISVIKGLYALRILDERLDGVNLMELFKDEIDHISSGNSVQEWSPQAEDIEPFTQGTCPFPEFSTPSEIGGVSIFETCYDDKGELKRDGLYTMHQISEPRVAETLGQPIQRRQGPEIALLSPGEEVQTGTLREIELSAQHNGRRVFTPGVDISPTVNEEPYRPNDFSGWVSSQQSSNQRSSGKRRYVGGMNLQRRKQRRFDCEFVPILRQEAEMTEALGLLPPQNTYFRHTIKTKLLDLEPDLISSLCLFLLQIGSARAFVTLQAALKSSRETKDHLYGAQSRKWVSRDLTLKDRFEVIGEIQENAAYLQILRCNHILNMYRQSGETAEHSSSFTIWAVPRDVLDSRPRARGNPKNIAVAAAVDKMMEKILPDLESSSAVYKRKRRKVLEFRKLGQRLDILAHRFGDAVLGLIHFDQPGETPGSVATEKIILEPTDETFENFVDILEESQGELLREISTAARSSFQHVLYEDMWRPDLFPLERHIAEDVLQLPKGSQELQNLLR